MVDLSEGLGPDNPPCPACDKPLFGWAEIYPGGEPVRRCELCGMAVVGPAASREEARAALERARHSGEALPNPASAQAWLGGSGWAGLNRDRRFLFTPDAVERLGERPERPGPDYVAMWHTMVNSFAFGHNFALGPFDRGPAAPAPSLWQRVIDGVILVATLVPLVVIALVIETIAWAAGGGGRLRLRG